MVVRLRPGDVKLYPGEPSRYVVDPDGPVIRDLTVRMTRSQLGARKLVGVRTGFLLSTIRKQPGFRATYVYVDLIAGKPRSPLAGIQEFGTPPHIIAARRRKSLRYLQGGRVVFRTAVHHPGTKATHFLSAALPLAGG
jgi:hypothetical protein